MAINSTPSSPDAVSYISVEYANSYFATKFGASAWLDFSDEEKEQLCVSATEELNVLKFGGAKSVNAQALEWPRAYLSDYSGQVISPHAIPANVMKATCEMAFWIWTEEDRMMSDTDLQQLESMKVGPLDLKVSKKPMVLPIKVEQLLSAVGPGAYLGSSVSSNSVRMCR